MSRTLFATAAVLTALVAQVDLVNRLDLPGDRPDLLLLVVVAFALSGGPLPGLLVGFGAGLAADLAPPADHAAGRLALTYTVIGYLAGLLRPEVARSAVFPIVVVALSSVGAVAIYAGLGALLSDPRVSWGVVVRGLPTVVLYDVLLTPFVVPVVLAVCRRLDPDAPRW